MSKFDWDYLEENKQDTIAGKTIISYSQRGDGLKCLANQVLGAWE